MLLRKSDCFSFNVVGAFWVRAVPNSIRPGKFHRLIAGLAARTHGIDSTTGI